MYVAHGTHGGVAAFRSSVVGGWVTCEQACTCIPPLALLNHSVSVNG